MEDILVRIVGNTRRELRERMSAVPLAEMKKLAHDPAPALDFAQSLLRKKPVGIIAEVKKASPSKGLIREDFDPVAIAVEYERAGADAISVLTDQKFFMGKLEFLADIRKHVSLPILRKDFIVDAYQVYEARANGADAVLLISEILSTREMRELLDVAHSLGMQALVESHDREHLEAALETDARLIGINNRDLATFDVDLATTEELGKLVPADRVLVGESGISTAADVARLAAAGVKAILVGETLIRADDITTRMKELMTGE